MANEPRHTMSRRQRIRTAVDNGTLGQIPVEDLRTEYGFRVSAGLMEPLKGKKEPTKADLVAAFSGEAEPAQPPTGTEG